MNAEIFLRYIHFVSIFTIVATIVSEHLILKKSMTRAEIGRLSQIDAVYGLAALSLLAAGFTLWLGGVGKPRAFYSGNWIFHTKIMLFLLVGILSIYPTVFFIRNRKGQSEERIIVPGSIFWLLRMELLLLTIIPFLAALMAKGIGLNID